MNAQTLTKKALKLYRALPKEQQQALLAEAEKPTPFGRVIQFDPSKKGAPQVVSTFFQMELNHDTPYVYLFANEIRENPYG